MAGADFGGHMKFRSSRGEQLSLRGTFNVLGGNVSVEGITNQDGSPDRVVTPSAPTAEIVFADKNVDLAELMSGERINISIVEERTGVTHLFTRAFYTGKASSNRLNGEVTAVGLMAEAYRRIG